MFDMVLDVSLDNVNTGDKGYGLRNKTKTSKK